MIENKEIVLEEIKKDLGDRKKELLTRLAMETTRLIANRQKKDRTVYGKYKKGKKNKTSYYVRWKRNQGIPTGSYVTLRCGKDRKTGANHRSMLDSLTYSITNDTGFIFFVGAEQRKRAIFNQLRYNFFRVTESEQTILNRLIKDF